MKIPLLFKWSHKSARLVVFTIKHRIVSKLIAISKSNLSVTSVFCYPVLITNLAIYHHLKIDLSEEDEE